jgi:PLD-like domain
MLEPHNRKLLFDVLRPPEGHTLDYAIATTYTLDLLALLTAPIAFTLFEADDPKKLLDTNSLTLLESLRRYADRMAIFHHGGYIAVPPAQFPQFEYLERIVVQCKPRVDAAVFHPKIWLLRFAGPEQRVTYRFACLSRNLTFDRCWDTVLTLEGQFKDRQNVIARNRPLADFVAALPSFAANVSQTITARIDQMQEEVRRVDFEPPEEIDNFAFHPLGLPSQHRRVPFERIGGRMAVISPFVTDDGLKRLVLDRKECVLISRSESLQQLTGELAEVGQMFSLNEQAETPEAAEDDIPLSRGLHAKCYVIDNGWKASIWTGSANATEQAFNGNVEFFVELIGPKSKFGVDALLRKEAGKTGFADLLVPFSKAADLTVDAIDEELAKRIDGVRRALAELSLHAVVTPTMGSDLFDLTLAPSVTDHRIPGGAIISCWPITLGKQAVRPVINDFAPIVFEGVSLEALTSFFAFEVVAAIGAKSRPETFVLNTTLEGAPSNRRERLLRSLIGDRQRFVRLLTCLLADEGFELADVMATIDRNNVGSASAETASTALFESLIRSLDRSPERLDHIASLVADLRKQGNPNDVFPPGFEQLWEPIWLARQEMIRS